MATNNHFDVIVLGLGVMGSAAAYHLARDGRRVLALEQFALDHKLGSSYGESRIIRYAYDHPVYVEMAKHSFPMWRELEEDSGQHLMYRTGGFDFGQADEPTLVATRDNLADAGVAHEWLTPDEAMRRFPQFHVDGDQRVLYQPDAGYLAASDCVITMAKCAQERGATLLTNTPVQRVEALTGRVRVYTANAQYEAASLVIAAGAWVGRLLESLDLKLPLHASREEQVFFAPTDPADMAEFMPDRFPIFIYHATPWMYGLPNVGGTGVKAAVHGRNEPVDPDHMKRTPDEDYIEYVRNFVHHHIPKIAAKVNEARVCLYTMTPDQHYIIDKHPAYPHIVYGAGFSGHGFKFGILVGRILADLARRGETDHDLTLFAASRFH